MAFTFRLALVHSGGHGYGRPLLDRYRYDHVGRTGGDDVALRCLALIIGVRAVRSREEPSGKAR